MIHPIVILEWTPQDSERFWDKVNVQQQDNCWEWQAGKFSKGYGAFSLNGKTVKAHRLAFAIIYLEQPNLVCHSCDNTSCCNPNHLFTGTPLSNMRDKVSKNRQTRTRGEKSGLCKISEVTVAEIRR